MDTSQLKMVIDAVNQLGGSAQFAFYLWVLVGNVSALLICIVIVGGILIGARMILRCLHESDRSEQLLRDLREGLEFSSYENAALVAHIITNTKPRKRFGES